MWLSEIGKRTEISGEKSAELGTVSIGGSGSAVMLSGECRSAELLAPAGIVRLPRAGERQLVILCGDGSRVLAGAVGMTVPFEPEAGDIVIAADGAAVVIRNGGGIELHGDVEVTGSLSVNGRTI